MNSAHAEQHHSDIEHDNHQDHYEQNADDGAERFGQRDQRQELLNCPPDNAEQMQRKIRPMSVPIIAASY